MRLYSLSWKYGSGCCHSHIDKPTGKIIITKWKLPQPEPTEAEIQQASDEYEQYLIDEETQNPVDFAAIKTKLKNKLGITTDAEWKKFRKLIKWIAENKGD